MPGVDFPSLPPVAYFPNHKFDFDDQNFTCWNNKNPEKSLTGLLIYKFLKMF